MHFTQAFLSKLPLIKIIVSAIFLVVFLNLFKFFPIKILLNYYHILMEFMKILFKDFFKIFYGLLFRFLKSFPLNSNFTHSFSSLLLLLHFVKYIYSTDLSEIYKNFIKIYKKRANNVRRREIKELNAWCLIQIRRPLDPR